MIACSNVKCHTRDPLIEKCVSPLKNVLLDLPYVSEKNEAADSAAAASEGRVNTCIGLLTSYREIKLSPLRQKGLVCVTLHCMVEDEF